MTTAQQVSAQPPASKVADLSPRELEIAQAVWSECADKLITAGLHISTGTLATHLGRIRRKLGVRTRTGIARQFERWRVSQNFDGGNTDRENGDMPKRKKCA